MRRIQHILTTALLLVALALAGPAAWAQLSVDSDIPAGTAGHWYVNMPRTGINTLTLSAEDLAKGKGTFKVYDNGGEEGNYSTFCMGNLIIFAPEGYVIQVSGTVWTKAQKQNEAAPAFLRVYNGSSKNNILADVSSPSDGVAIDFGPVTTTDNAISFYFQNSDEDTYQGLDLTVRVFENTLYKVSVATGIEHGTVVASPEEAYYNSDITLTVTPDENYYIGTVSYNDGTDHVITPVNDIYSFKMPKHDVTVSATFLDEQEYLWGEGNDGTEAKPYVIRDKAGWDLLVEKTNFVLDNITNGKHFRLDADISGVTRGLRYFYGYLDGNHHKITLASAEGGFIGTSSEGFINDLTLEGSLYNGFVIGNASSLFLTNCFFNVTYTGNGTLELVHNGTVLSTNCAYLLNGEATFASGNIALNARIPAYLLTLTGSAVAIRPGGTPIGDGSVTVYADGFTFGSAEYYKQYATVTFGVPGASFASATYNDGSNSYSARINDDGSASFEMPARAVTVSIAGYTARYIDADGTEKTHSVTLLTDGGPVEKPAGWYVVYGNVRITDGLRFSGDAHLILADGATLTVDGGFDGEKNQTSVRSNGNLSIYGQTLGTGTLKARAHVRGLAFKDEDYFIFGIRTKGGNITLCGGSVNAEAFCDNYKNASGIQPTYAICADGSISVVRGNVNAVCRRTLGGLPNNYFRGITVGEGGTITLGWGSTTDSIYATSYYGTVKIADGQTLYNGSTALNGTIADNGQIDGTTLKPYPGKGTTLQANQASFAGQTHYWATFYHPNYNYKLPAGAEAFTMGSDHALYRVGDGSIVPSDCAVVIIADASELTLTLTGNSATPEDGNILKGSGTAVPVSGISGTPYVLGIVNGTLGFYPYTGENIPANKAYYVEP